MSRKQFLQRMHRKGARSAYEAAAFMLLFFGLMAVSLLAWHHGYWPVTLVCWLLQAHVGHANLLAFHEASHFVLHPSRRLNELQGIIVGSTILTPLSAYRWVHNQHHFHLGTERDAELWPYVDPSAPRWRRRLAAAAELLLGFFYTPVIFLRGVLAAERLPRPVVRRLVGEYALCAAVWGVVIGAVACLGVWEELVIGYLVPSLLAGNLQSLRKFTEHLGLLGGDVPSTTRTVVDRSLAGRLLSASLLHIDLHGPHHRHAKVPHFRLREATPVVYERELREPAAANVFRWYPAAVWAMLQTLGDPRVGAQWLRGREQIREDAAGMPLAPPRGGELPVRQVGAHGFPGQGDGDESDKDHADHVKCDGPGLAARPAEQGRGDQGRQPAGERRG
jgi:fatty acid desaturase